MTINNNHSHPVGHADKCNPELYIVADKDMEYRTLQLKIHIYKKHMPVVNG